MLEIDRPARNAVLRWVGALSALLLITLLVDWGQVVAALQRVSGPALVAGFALNLATRLAAALRTWLLSRGAGLSISFGQTVRALFIANFWGMAIPGVSAGSVATVLQYRRQGAGIAQSIAVLAASRVVELAAFAAVALLGVALGSDRIGTRGPSLFVVLALAILLPVIMVRWLRRRPGSASPSETGQAQTGVRGLLARVRVKLRETRELLASLSNGALLLGGAAALFQAVLDAATLLALAMGLGLPLLLSQALWINALSYFAILLPLSVAGLGLREAAILAALLPLGIARGDALALALLMLAMTIGNALVGALLHWRVRPVAPLRPAESG